MPFLRRIMTKWIAFIMALVLAACESPVTPQTTAIQTFAPTLTPLPISSPTQEILVTATSTPISINTWSSESPDGKWIVEGMMKGPFADLTNGTENYYIRMKVISVNGTATWTVADQTLPYGLGYT